jgi:hypothetical protein
MSIRILQTGGDTGLCAGVAALKFINPVINGSIAGEVRATQHFNLGN